MSVLMAVSPICQVCVVRFYQPQRLPVQLESVFTIVDRHAKIRRRNHGAQRRPRGGRQAMRNAVLALIAVLVGSATAPAQTEQWANKLFAKPHGEGTTPDFGSIPRGTVLTHRFPMKH